MGLPTININKISKWQPISRNKLGENVYGVYFICYSMPSNINFCWNKTIIQIGMSYNGKGIKTRLSTFSSTTYKQKFSSAKKVNKSIKKELNIKDFYFATLTVENKTKLTQKEFYSYLELQALATFWNIHKIFPAFNVGLKKSDSGKKKSKN
jgi:hypothetical protein